MSRRKGVDIPDGWAMNEDGKTVTDPNEVKFLYPLGGDETHSGFKGYGLGMMVEILCGILGGGNYSNKVRRWGSTNDEANLGQVFMAIDPKFFAPGFDGRMSDLLERMRDLESAVS